MNTFNTYKLKVSSDLYIMHYNIKSKTLQEASKQARYKFAKQFKQVGDKVKVSLQPEDLKNHINEIMENLSV